MLARVDVPRAHGRGGALRLARSGHPQQADPRKRSNERLRGAREGEGEGEGADVAAGADGDLSLY